MKTRQSTGSPWIKTGVSGRLTPKVKERVMIAFDNR